MNLFMQLIIGGAMIGLTVVIHAITLDFIMKRIDIAGTILKRAVRYLWKPVMTSAIVVIIFATHIVHIWLWAWLYLALNCLPHDNISDALYFSAATYTTLGYGDITLEPSFRMLSGIEAGNGFLLFGWTTAFIFEITSKLYKRDINSQ